MPKLIKLYIRHSMIGFAIAAVFVALLIGLNVQNLRGLITGSDIGWLAVLMLWVMNGIVFAGVQFGWAVMSMASPSTHPPRGGRPTRLIPVPVRSSASRKP